MEAGGIGPNDPSFHGNTSLSALPFSVLGLGIRVELPDAIAASMGLFNHSLTGLVSPEFRHGSLILNVFVL